MAKLFLQHLQDCLCNLLGGNIQRFAFRCQAITGIIVELLLVFPIEYIIRKHPVNTVLI